MSEEKYEFKVVIVGNARVGKTSMLLRLTDGIYSDSTPATIGVEYKSFSFMIDDIEVKLNIWDTAGQERFRALTAQYYKGADGIIIVYDCSDLISFEKIQDWLEEVDKNIDDDPCILLVGNKCDLIATRQVYEVQAKRFAEEHGLYFIETSAKLDTNIYDTFHELSIGMLRRRLAPKPQQDHSNTPIIVDEKPIDVSNIIEDDSKTNTKASGKNGGCC
ncbi:Rab1L1, Rab1-like protein [Monocercomonoides exilis]|uniref:Rab1L1, Rab1-like protein n=1 Tax=Monocercomonoides exilis TaxID=2049356 RepID=UPI00355A8950|nr:Rab1L1, Rab1-like protein [Monocercomonoides exilis]|eukprot:MONOS_10633.1-p1 / transcript=MONOS_10633.1 / gene=MONOS_10633 / organism=Monocercomonoides_exilis_PA203 / gene_product=Rab1L1, Rab1-like protein / transcript_product=Rab1L1, Rab1-like protein / location=Mono_scaffold00491:23065-23925(-) / protein_length=218 / sequence_SO=supercontig / SO=protein_coding / is_pseudo=false